MIAAIRHWWSGCDSEDLGPSEDGGRRHRCRYCHEESCFHELPPITILRAAPTRTQEEKARG